MQRKHLLKEILEATKDLWHRPDVRSSVRDNFAKTLACGTPALGWEVYASETEERIVYHRCKSRSCPSCGYRATLLWQQQQEATLPEIPYAGIVFTMPRSLWRIFKQNRHLLHDLPALGAVVIQHWVKIRYGVRVLILAVPHTFGGDLKFNTHLHILVSSVGLQELDGGLSPRLRFNREALMRMWRYAVITHLRGALKANVLKCGQNVRELSRLFTSEYERPFWIIYVDEIVSKEHFVKYASRYVRRPPIAQRRLLNVTDREVVFLAKVRKQSIQMHYSLSEFVATLATHVPDRYRHTIRYFGLLAPRAKGQTETALFAMLGQEKKARPTQLSWRNSLIKCFETDPLIDKNGQTMHWVRRQQPITR